jgi:hypothetical protein
VATSHKICGYSSFVATFLWLVATKFAASPVCGYLLFLPMTSQLQWLKLGPARMFLAGRIKSSKGDTCNSKIEKRKCYCQFCEEEKELELLE